MTKAKATLAATAAAPRGDRLIRLDDVLARVPVGSSTIYSLMARGAFPACRKIGRTTVWRESDIDAYVAGTWEPAMPGDRIGEQRGAYLIQ